MLLEKLIMTEFSAQGFDTMQSTVARLHDIKLIDSEEIGDPREPDSTILHMRVDGTDVLLELTRLENGQWGKYLFDEARLAAPEGKPIAGDAGKVPDDLKALLRAYFPQSSPDNEAQPKPN